MIIKIKGSTIANETVNLKLIETLYNLFSNNHTNCELEGHIQIDYVYEIWINYLENLYNKFKCSINRELLIWFDDENVKQILINKLSLGNIGGVPVSKKIDLTSIETWFKDNTLIETFNELNLFKSITILNDKAFSNCSVLRQINLSNVQQVGVGCFAYDARLSSDINMPNLTHIKNSAFRDCTSLSSISNLGNLTPENCGNGVFYNCTGLQSVVLPETLHAIKENTFWKCLHLSEINFPEVLTVIERNGLRGTALTDVNFANITTLGQAAFAECASLECDIDIPNLTNANAGIFYGCTSIKKIVNLGSITKLDAVQETDKYLGAFAGCTALEEATLPSSLKTLNYAFRNCNSLKTIKGNPQFTTIGPFAFEFCYNLETNILNSNIAVLGDRALIRCEKMNITEINLPNLGTLGKSVFAGLKQITRVTSLGNTITELGTIWNNYGDYGDVGMFEQCINLTDVNLPNTITKFDYRTFAGCTKLKNLNIPTSLTSLGNRCFRECSALNNAILYFKNVTTLGEVVFMGATIGEMYFPSITTIFNGYWRNYVSTSGTFAGYHNAWFTCNLLYLKLDSNVIIKDGTFAHSEIINLVINNATPPTLEQYAFGDSDVRYKLTNIWVPNSSVNTYKAAANWSKFASKIKSIDDYPYIVNTEADYRALQQNGDNNIYLIREYMS